MTLLHIFLYYFLCPVMEALGGLHVREQFINAWIDSGFLIKYLEEPGGSPFVVVEETEEIGLHGMVVLS